MFLFTLYCLYLFSEFFYYKNQILTSSVKIIAALAYVIWGFFVGQGVFQSFSNLSLVLLSTILYLILLVNKTLLEVKIKTCLGLC